MRRSDDLTLVHFLVVVNVLQDIIQTFDIAQNNARNANAVQCHSLTVMSLSSTLFVIVIVGKVAETEDEIFLFATFNVFFFAFVCVYVFIFVHCLMCPCYFCLMSCTGKRVKKFFRKWYDCKPCKPARM